MSKESYILNNIYYLNKLAGRILDANGDIIAVPYKDFSKNDPIFNNALLKRQLMDTVQMKNTQEYKSFNDEGFWHYTIFSSDKYVIWRPVLFEDYSKYDKHLYCKKYGVNKEIIMQTFEVERVEKIINFSHSLLFDQYDEQVSIQRDNKNDKLNVTLKTECSEYALEKFECKKYHYSFIEEQQMWQWFIRGRNVEEINSVIDNIVNGVGIMAESQKKKIEYESVCGITLATRYAIEAGVSDNEAYNLSDISLQKLSKTTDVREMKTIYDATLEGFVELVKNVTQKENRYNRYIEYTCEYIAGHIYQKITVPEIADEVGLHPVYLSRLFFKEMGMSIREYVMREKIRISCNLLRYSDRSISEIAEYMSLAPQSYFTREFKAILGETPAKYRKIMFDKKFIEKV